MVGVPYGSRLSSSAWAAGETMWKFLGGVAIFLGAIASIIVIKNQFFSGPPKFSGNLTGHGSSASFASFLSKNGTKTVNINATCNTYSGSACAAKAGTNNSPEVVLYSGPNNGESAVIMFVQTPGASGTLSSPGAGYISITGAWSVQSVGSGGYSPEGVPSYQLTAAS
jgi:hypothetical protein